MRIVAVLTAAALGAALATTASAQQIPSDAERAAMFKVADKNADGKLDKTEYLSMLPDEAKDFADQLFAARDTDKDGFVSAAESAAPLNF